MARTAKEHPTTWLQPECKNKHEINPSVPQQEEQTDATEGKDIVDFNSNVDYEGSEPKNKPVAQQQKEEDSYAKIELPQDGTFC